jgi:hypothetical protein
VSEFVRTESPGHGREVLAGAIVGATFHKQVTDKHFFKIWKSYAIQEDVFQQLVKGGIQRIQIDVIKATEETPPVGNYVSGTDEWLEPKNTVTDRFGYGLQRFFPFHRMRRL